LEGVPDEFTALWTRIIPIDRRTKTAEVARGGAVPVDKPFFGTMGIAPDATLCRISSGPFAGASAAASAATA